MKKLMCGLATSLGIFASNVKADQTIIVDGEEYLLSALTENCQSITGDPAAQVACFTALSKLLDEQSSADPVSEVSVTEALDALRAVAQYLDEDSGLLIAGSDCTIHILYFANYFHISRRNVSTIDLYSAQFDAAQFLPDQTVAVQSGQALLSKGFMDAGANAAMRGGMALDSTQLGFSPRSPAASIDAYANEIVGQLPATQAQSFDFAMVHPQRSHASADIWNAFETFVNVCRG